MNHLLSSRVFCTHTLLQAGLGEPALPSRRSVVANTGRSRRTSRLRQGCGGRGVRRSAEGRGRQVWILILLIAVCASCGGSGARYTEEQAARARTTIETVQIRDVAPGTGDAAEPGRRLVVHYSGWLYDSAAADHRGQAFDSSRTRGRPYDFVLGAAEVIPGWERGVAGMKEGGTRELTIPSRLAYGAEGSPPNIPPDATLVFEIELMDVR